MTSKGLNRRQAATGMAATGALMTSGLPAAAQQITRPNVAAAWRELIAIVEEAKRLGLGVPVVTAPAEGTTAYDQILPVVVDVIEDLDDEATTNPALKAEIERLKARARALQQGLTQRERSPRQRSDLPAHRGSFSFIATAEAQENRNEKRFRDYHDGYLRLFDSCVIRPEKKSEVDWYVNKLLNDRYRGEYAKVEAAACCPWYFVGIIHALEAGFNFDGHLHNGDPLDKQTVNVPAKRPPNWNPPGTWVQSAKDALEYDDLVDLQDWSLAATMFRWELYNGFRSRELHSINTPYLWSFSTHYTRGKFIADDVWSASAVSNQCGAAVMLRELVNRDIVRFT
jgi:lysozyme family protein